MDRHAGNQLGIYLSIPFCRSKCTYCNFASGVYPASDHERYVERLVEDLSGARTWATKLGAELPREVDTVYLGGGTPSLLEPMLLKQLFAVLRAEFSLDRDAEITMECAPGQISEETLAAMADCGVNRVSLGVQSFVDREAQVSGRLHTRAIVERDVERLRAAGIVNLNLDLIAGLAGQTLASWDESLAALVASGAPHASVYMLEVDEDSRLGREMLAGGARYYAELTPSEDTVARMYERAIERLSEAGLAQYEISNFCRPGFASRHNIRYWQRRPYLGVGLDASSALFCKTDTPFHDKSTIELLRTTTTDDLNAYLAGPQTVEANRLAPREQLEEAWFLGLRLNDGVSLESVEQEFGSEALAAAMEKLNPLEASGLVSVEGGTVRLTARGRMISNDVFQEFLGLGTKAVSSLVS